MNETTGGMGVLSEQLLQNPLFEGNKVCNRPSFINSPWNTVRFIFSTFGEINMPPHD
jgi:hypothetical protein